VGDAGVAGDAALPALAGGGRGADGVAVAPGIFFAAAAGFDPSFADDREQEERHGNMTSASTTHAANSGRT
jgi:hypothetical protein